MIFFTPRIIRTLLVLLLITVCTSLLSQEIGTLPKEKQGDVDRYLELVSRYKQAGNTEQAIFYLNRVAFTYWEYGNLREAVSYFLESVPLNNKVKNYNDIKAIYSNIGLIYADLGHFDLALEYFNKSLETRRYLNNKAELAAGLIDVAYIHRVLKQHDKAIPLLEEALSLSRDVGNPRLTLNCLQHLSANYNAIGNLAKAQEMNNESTLLRQQVAKMDVEQEYEKIVSKTEAEVERERIQRTAQALEMELRKIKSQATEDSLSFALKAQQDSLDKVEEIVLRRQQEIELLESRQKIQELAEKEQQAQLQAQQTIIYSVLGGFILLLALSAFILKGYRDKRRANTLLSHQNEEINEQKDQIQRQNENISKSINYAQGIQKALLPVQKHLENFFPESFIYFKPRDVVSGDYYWFKPIVSSTEKYNPKIHKVAISAIDCTGHGVPGAFLSMIGYNLLDEILDKKVHEPGEILMELNKGIIRTLRQDETDNRDGMDMSLCVWDPQKRVIEYAGAKNPLVYIQNDELFRIRGDKESIGGGGANADLKFTTHTIEIDGPTWVYLFSDGYIDQFGGDNGRKFMIKNFIKLLEHIHKFSGNEQREILRITFKEWKRDKYDQIDDVLVMGFNVG